MSEQLILKNLPFIKILPAWAQELSYKYCSKTANLYILHGNIRDLLPHKMNEGEFIFARIQEYVSEVLFGNRDIIVFYDRSSGVSFCSPEMARDYAKVMRSRFPDVEESDLVSSDPEKSFYYLEKYFLLNIPQKRRIVMILDYAETIVPAGDLIRLSDEDRYCLVTLNRWSNDPIFTKGDVSIILLTENLTDISPRLVGSPATVKVDIPIPDQAVRASFLHFMERKGNLLLDRGLDPDRVAAVTSGLNLMNLNRLVAESYQEDAPLSLDYIGLKKKEIIENEAAGLLEFMDTVHDLSYVSGHDFVKKRFKNAARAIKQGRLDVLPMGYLIAGPVGTGKSFMVSAFAGEIGIPMVKFRNFRSKWQGVTESNLERVLNILKAMSPVAVMIDEADAFLGDRDQDGDSGTSNRVFAQIASFMGNTEYRGKIIWFLITCRPDLIPIDLKRQGRAEEHLALFYPESDHEREALFDTLVRKLNLSIRKFSISDLFKKFRHEFSGADLEAVLIRAKLHAAMADRTFVTKEDMEEVMGDFVPPAYPYEIELQNLVAVLECTSKEMVPKRFQNPDRTKLVKDIQELKSLLGERG
ncbi:ATP-binding protein [Breznakiella homolactica]|uniref:ATP-binding protein n=1 Tax=Breznakiella homolactica TaxID=2798577 RepID=UPI001CBA5F59|nr:AAA family ATPase [Breznakiella homolactica]